MTNKEENENMEFENLVESTDSQKMQAEALSVAKLSKDVKKSFLKYPSKEEARFLCDIYYQTQAKRIATEGQLRSLEQGADLDLKGHEKSTSNMTFLNWHYMNEVIEENNIKNALEIFSDNNYLSRWAKQVTGIGPVISSCLCAMLEIKEEQDGSTTMHAGSWWSYCGLNDNNRPWLSSEKSRKMIDSCIEENGGVLDDSTVYLLCDKSSWNFEHFAACKDNNGKWDKIKLAKAASIIPYNKDLKVLMYKIGHSFRMVKNNPNSLYGKLLKEREEYENIKNARGDYSDQALKILESKNIGKNTTAYQYYIKGQLPPAHIAQRCERYVTKLFISHLFEAEYYNKYGVMAPKPYVLCFDGKHTDYIGPEVPYDSVERD